jgi:hypothetical protein
VERWITILIIVCICVIGVIKILFRYRNISINKDFTIDYINKYRELGNGLFKGQMNEEVYEWLSLKSSKMQNIMGSYGIASLFQPPFSKIAYKNYHIVYNGLSEIRKQFSLSQPMVGFGGSLTYQNLYDKNVR